MATKGVQAELDALKRLREADVLFEAGQRRLVTDQMIFWRKTARWLALTITDVQILEEYDRIIGQFNAAQFAEKAEGNAAQAGEPGDHGPDRAAMGENVNPSHPGRGARNSARTDNITASGLFGPIGEGGEAETSTAYTD